MVLFATLQLHWENILPQYSTRNAGSGTTDATKFLQA